MKRIILMISILLCVMGLNMGCSRVREDTRQELENQKENQKENQEKNQEENQEKSKEENQGEENEESDPFFAIINRIGSTDAYVVHELGEGRIHRHLSTEQMTGRSYQLNIFENEEPVDVYFGYDEDMRVNSIEITLFGEDIEGYREQLEVLLGGDYDSMESGEVQEGYEWLRNNILIELSEQEDSLVIAIQKNSL